MEKEKKAADELAELILNIIKGSGIGLILGIIVLAVILILGNKGIIYPLILYSRLLRLTIMYQETMVDLL